MRYPDSPADPCTLDFTTLPQPVRDAFARAINENRAPLADLPSNRVAPWGFAGGLLLLGVIFFGFGSEYPGYVCHGPGLIPVYALAVAPIAAAVVLRRRHRALARLLGCPPGVYVLGTGLIDARSRTVKAFDLRTASPDILRSEPSDWFPDTVLTWHGYRFVSWRAPVARVLAVLSNQLQARHEAVRNADLERLLVLDPIAAILAFGNNTTSPPPTLAAGRWRAWVRPMVVAVGLAAATWHVRNVASLELAFHGIRDGSDARTWVDNGGDPARGRARAMALDLADAKYSNSAQTLRQALARYPEAPDDLRKPVELALRTRYETARAAALRLSPSKSMTAFINQIYDGLEANTLTPTIHVFVSRINSDELTVLDESLSAAGPAAARITRVAKYFAAVDEGTRSTKVKRAIENGLYKFFPSDVMQPSETFDQGQAKLEITYVVRPQLDADDQFVFYDKVDAAGRIVPGTDVYPGVELELGATLSVPGESRPQRVVFTAHPAPTIDLAPGADTSDVYGAMTDSAFTDLEHQLVHALGG